MAFPKERVGISVDKSLLVRVRYTLTEYDPVDAVHLPISERVLDKLGDILLASDEILGMIATNPQFPSPTTRSVEDSVRKVYDQINELMKALSD